MIRAILFVCTGNICRSPMAHALLQRRAADRGIVLIVDSVAISAEEQGNQPDPRAVAELERHGVRMPAHRARRVLPEDFARFDLLVGMTRAHCEALARLAPADAAHKVRLLLDFSADHAGREVPDPWYGRQQAFVEAFGMIETGVEALLSVLEAAGCRAGQASARS